MNRALVAGLLLVGVPNLAFAVASADLSITKTDGVVTATPGGSVTYTITASNAGPSSATNVTVADTFPAAFTCTWTCLGAGGGSCAAAGSGNINDATNLPAGASVTYTAGCTISASATGTLSNTATVSAVSVVDPVPGNNSATDTDTLVAQADLTVTKTDGVTTATPGGSVTYTITASNAGPSNASGATVGDTFPASLTCTWTCVGAGGGTCTAAGSGNVNDTVNLPSGGSVTFTASCAISAGATGTISNTATVSLAAEATDPSPGNNIATDTDTLSAEADLAVTKTDGVTVADAGGSVTYTITASNAGPSNAPGATVDDTFPTSLTCTWTCLGAGGGTCTASGSGNISDTVNLPNGGAVTYTASCAVSTAATETLANTVVVAAPAGVTDANPGNNSATDTDTVNATADLAITSTDNTTTLQQGASTVYLITVTNDGPADVVGATVQDMIPATLDQATWTCVGDGGGTCTASGSGNIDDTVNLPVGASLTYSLSATNISSSDDVINTATVSSSSAVTDPDLTNNTATDSDDTTLPPPPDAVFNLGLALTASKTHPAPGDALDYTVNVTNAGPDAASSFTLTVTLPLGVTVTATPADCSIAGVVVTCSLTGLADGDTLTLTINTMVGTSVENGTDLSAATALVTSDSDASNNQSTVTVTATTVPASDDGGGGSTSGTQKKDDGCAASSGGLLPALLAGLLLWHRRRP